MYELKIKDSKLPPVPEKRDVNEVLRYPTIMTNSINGIVAIHHWLKREPRKEFIDPIIKAFGGAFLFYVGERPEKGGKKGEAAIYKVYGNPLDSETNGYWIRQITEQRQRLLKAVRVALEKRKIDVEQIDKPESVLY
jgi:hypothetical protein